jgi:hypothetical protein
MYCGSMSSNITLNAEVYGDVFTAHMQNVTVAPAHSVDGFATFCNCIAGTTTKTRDVTQYVTVHGVTSTELNVAHATFVTIVPSAVIAPAPVPYAVPTAAITAPNIQRLTLTAPSP